MFCIQFHGKAWSYQKMLWEWSDHSSLDSCIRSTEAYLLGSPKDFRRSCPENRPIIQDRHVIFANKRDLKARARTIFYLVRPLHKESNQLKPSI
jgi:hypothetical protein